MNGNDARKRVKLCSKYSELRQDCSGNCNELHICRRWLGGSCAVRDCKFYHSLKTEHNVSVLIHYGFLASEDSITCEERLRKNVYWHFPVVCVNYNAPRSCTNEDTCGYVHICKRFLLNGSCLCTLRHNLSGNTNLAILARFGMHETQTKVDAAACYSQLLIPDSNAVVLTCDCQVCDVKRAAGSRVAEQLPVEALIQFLVERDGAASWAEVAAHFGMPPAFLGFKSWARGVQQMADPLYTYIDADERNQQLNVYRLFRLCLKYQAGKSDAIGNSCWKQGVKMCTKLHVCRFYVADMCPVDPKTGLLLPQSGSRSGGPKVASTRDHRDPRCTHKMSHSFDDPVLVKLGLSELPEWRLLELVRISHPRVCRDYAFTSCVDSNCYYMHVCNSYVAQYELAATHPRCGKNHDLLSEQCVRVLDRLHLNNIAQQKGAQYVRKVCLPVSRNDESQRTERRRRLGAVSEVAATVPRQAATPTVPAPVFRPLAVSYQTIINGPPVIAETRPADDFRIDDSDFPALPSAVPALGTASANNQPLNSVDACVANGYVSSAVGVANPFVNSSLNFHSNIFENTTKRKWSTNDDDDDDDGDDYEQLTKSTSPRRSGFNQPPIGSNQMTHDSIRSTNWTANVPFSENTGFGCIGKVLSNSNRAVGNAVSAMQLHNLLGNETQAPSRPGFDDAFPKHAPAAAPAPAPVSVLMQNPGSNLLGQYSASNPNMHSNVMQSQKPPGLSTPPVSIGFDQNEKPASLSRFSDSAGLLHRSGLTQSEYDLFRSNANTRPSIIDSNNDSDPSASGIDSNRSVNALIGNLDDLLSKPSFSLGPIMTARDRLVPMASPFSSSSSTSRTNSVDLRSAVLATTKMNLNVQSFEDNEVNNNRPQKSAGDLPDSNQREEPDERDGYVAKCDFICEKNLRGACVFEPHECEAHHVESSFAWMFDVSVLPANSRPNLSNAVKLANQPGIWLPFSSADSARIENAFCSLKRTYILDTLPLVPAPSKGSDVRMTVNPNGVTVVTANANRSIDDNMYPFGGLTELNFGELRRRDTVTVFRMRSRVKIRSGDNMFGYSAPLQIPVCCLRTKSTINLRGAPKSTKWCWYLQPLVAADKDFGAVSWVECHSVVGGDNADEVEAAFVSGNSQHRLRLKQHGTVKVYLFDFESMLVKVEPDCLVAELESRPAFEFQLNLA